MTTKNALFCCSALAGYFHNSIAAFAEKYNVSCHVVTLSKSVDSPYQFANHPLIKIYNKSDFRGQQFFLKFSKLDPTIVYIPGWIDRDYIKLASQFRKRNTPVIMGLDNHWLNSWRQKIGALYMKRKLASAVSHIWIPGTPQYHFAIKLGFKDEQIITGLYSANTQHFKKGFVKEPIKRNILFVGRLVDYKRPLELYQIFKTLPSEIRKEWTLTFIGRGKIHKELKECESIKVIDFVQPNDLIDYAQKASVFCLPSIREHWGVALHEFCAAGKVLIASNTVGAASEFLIPEHNGFLFNSNNLKELENCITTVIKMTDSEISQFQERSYQLGQSITPEIWAEKLYTLIK